MRRSHESVSALIGHHLQATSFLYLQTKYDRKELYYNNIILQNTCGPFSVYISVTVLVVIENACCDQYGSLYMFMNSEAVYKNTFIVPFDLCDVHSRSSDLFALLYYSLSLECLQEIYCNTALYCTEW